MEELDIKTAIQIAKILAAAPDERIPMILDVFSKAQVDINGLDELAEWRALDKQAALIDTDAFVTELTKGKELEDGEGYPEMDKLAHTILDTLDLNKDGEDVHMAYGTIVNELKEVSRSYKEARMALDVGKIFFGDKEVIAYSSLGIGRLIYQLPIPLCKMFIREIFDNKSPDDFDEETLVTIDKFFENSLNVSETSRQLYIHRNTLVYRLDKLQKSTGLDLRVFEDAITFKIALMVVRYMKYMETLEY